MGPVLLVQCVYVKKSDWLLSLAADECQVDWVQGRNYPLGQCSKPKAPGSPWMQKFPSCRRKRGGKRGEEVSHIINAWRRRKCVSDSHSGMLLSTDGEAGSLPGTVAFSSDNTTWAFSVVETEAQRHEETSPIIKQVSEWRWRSSGQGWFCPFFPHSLLGPHSPLLNPSALLPQPTLPALL